MKKIALLFTFAIAAFTANAQLTLTGTSYTQNFDALTTSGIPTGWSLYNSASAASLGTVDLTYGNSTTWGAYFDTSGCPSDVYGTGFKNCASADNGPLAAMATCALQEAKTNRALGVRQSSATSHPGYDAGASFALQLANTTGDSAFTVSFNLQTLDSASPRITTWTLDYGIGASPSTFTPITTSPATLKTGGYTFNNQLVTATLPSAVNNQSQPVWIRISALVASTGSGNRTTTGIDDFHLAWNSGSTAVANVPVQSLRTLAVLGQATSDKITFAYVVEQEGAYSLSVYDLAGRIIHTETVNATVGNQTITVNGLHLMPGMYIAKMNNGNSSSVARIAVQ